MILVGGRNYLPTFRRFFFDVKQISYEEFFLCDDFGSRSDLIVFMASPWLSLVRTNKERKDFEFSLALKRKINERKMIFISSAAVYGLSEAKHPFSEKSDLNGSTPYALEKIKFEREFSKLVNDLVIIRPSGFYGNAGDHMPYSFINRLKSCLENSKGIKFNIDYFGKQIRDFTHVMDLIQLIYESSKISKSGDTIYNLRSTRAHVLDEVINYIKIKDHNIRFNYEINSDREIHSSLDIKSVSKVINLDFNKSILDFLGV
jgi:nucleoside-diphosphate-sugar epimerase